jgi:hypothetical protein
MILTVGCTVDDADSANRFCVRLIPTADVRWPYMLDSSDSIQHYLLHVSWSFFW